MVITEDDPLPLPARQRCCPSMPSWEVELLAGWRLVVVAHRQVDARDCWYFPSLLGGRAAGRLEAGHGSASARRYSRLQVFSLPPGRLC